MTTLKTSDARQLGLHHGVLIDDFCSFATELRTELLMAKRWKVMRLGESYGFQTGITTGHIQGRFPDLPVCHRLEESVLDSAARLCELVEVTPTGPVAVDFSGMAYGEGGELRRHTDSVGDRHVAWILYLTPPEDGEWTEDDGGALVLSASSGETRSLYPKFNRLAAFAVTDESVHEILPVRRETPWERSRLVLTGWIHGRLPTEA